MDQSKEKILNSDLRKAPEISPSGEKVESLEPLSARGQGERIRQVVETAEESESTNDHAFSEHDQAGYRGKGSQVKTTSGNTVIAAAPSIDVMIRQTVEAVQFELKKNEQEMKAMLKNKSTSYYQINNQVQKIRFLNGILLQLSRAARLAEEFIVGLWKQYVKKV